MKGNKVALLFVANGITKDACDEIERLAGTGLYIIVVDSSDLKRLKIKSDCKAMILDKYYELLELAKDNLML